MQYFYANMITYKECRIRPLGPCSQRSYRRHFLVIYCVYASLLFVARNSLPTAAVLNISTRKSDHRLYLKTWSIKWKTSCVCCVCFPHSALSQFHLGRVLPGPTCSVNNQHLLSTPTLGLFLLAGCLFQAGRSVGVLFSNLCIVTRYMCILLRLEAPFSAK